MPDGRRSSVAAALVPRLIALHARLPAAGADHRVWLLIDAGQLSASSVAVGICLLPLTRDLWILQRAVA